MIRTVNFKAIVVEIIVLLYILLFVYAAVSKLLDFENFQVQLGQSPLLSAFALYISWGVPILELILSGLLFIRKYRFLGIILSYLLMLMFTVYIYIVLNYSSYVPCSCGGILEKLNWSEHLIFNLSFVLLGIVALFILLTDSQYSNRRSRIILLITGSSIISIGIVYILFLLSENIIHQDNPFIRRFEKSASVKSAEYELHYNSYYFAGLTDGTLFLGNHTAPLLLTKIDTALMSAQKQTIILDTTKIKYSALTISIRGSHFFLMDGNVPSISVGNLIHWKARSIGGVIPHFSQIEPIDSTRIAFRGQNPNNGAHILGVFDLENHSINYGNDVLAPHKDGIFASDGLLKYDNEKKQLVYLYYYRNEILSMDTHFSLVKKSKTIDTLSQSQLEVVYVSSRREHKFSAPPILVNKTFSVAGGLLYVVSPRRGRFETKTMWKHATVIDVYDLSQNKYLTSIYIYNENGKQLQTFLVSKNKLYALVGTKLVAYTLDLFRIKK